MGEVVVFITTPLNVLNLVWIVIDSFTLLSLTPLCTKPLDVIINNITTFQNFKHHFY